MIAFAATLLATSCAHKPESAAYWRELYEDCREQARDMRLQIQACEKEYAACVKDLYDLRVSCD